MLDGKRRSVLRPALLFSVDGHRVALPIDKKSRRIRPISRFSDRNVEGVIPPSRLVERRTQIRFENQ